MKCIWKRAVKCDVHSMMYSIEYRYVPIYHSYLVYEQIHRTSATHQICYGILSKKQLLYQLHVAVVMRSYFPGAATGGKLKYLMERLQMTAKGEMLQR